nr:hypothetical protein [Pandoravirus massiliensis]
MSTAADKPSTRARCRKAPREPPFLEPTSRTDFLQSLDNPLYDEQVYNNGSRLSRAAAAAPCDQAPLPYLVDDDGLPCLELLLSDAFAAAGCLAMDAYPHAPTPPRSGKRAATSKACAPAAKKRATVQKPHRPAPAPSHKNKKESHATKKRKQERVQRAKPRDPNDAPLTTKVNPAALNGAATSVEQQQQPQHQQPQCETSYGGLYAEMLAPRRLARVLPRADMTLPVTWYQPPCPGSAQHSAPPVRLYRRSAAAAALASLCHAVRINVPTDASLDRAIDAVLSIPHASADARRPHDADAVTRVGWVALMGNHDLCPLAERITPIWAGRAASLASSGLHIVAPTYTSDDVTPEQRALRVLSTEAHMPWFAARVRAVAHETLMGTPALLGGGLFDVLPVDTFLVLDLDAHGAARPYDIYIVPRVDLLTSRLAPG